MKEKKNFWTDDRGVGVIEMVLLLVILIGVALIFQSQIQSLVNNAFQAIGGDADKIFKR